MGQSKTEMFSFSNGRGETLAGRLEVPVGERVGVALFAHCFTCSKNVTAASVTSRALADRGLAVLRFDFTGLGNSEGDFANTNFSSNTADLIAAADALKNDLGRAPDLLVGHSLGGAAVLAAAPEIPSATLVATIGAPSEPGHVKHLFEGHIDKISREGRAEVQLAGRTFTIEEQFLKDVVESRLLPTLRELRRALLIFHSPVDTIVSIDHAQKIYQSARHPKSFISLDRADHLLSEPRDAEFVAATLAIWARRYAQTSAGNSSDTQ